MYDLYRLNFDELLDYIKSIGGAIVVWRPVGGIGDAVMMLPAVTALRTEWGDAVPIIVLCVDYIEPIFRHHPDVDCVISLTQDEIGRYEDRIKAEQLAGAGAIIHPLYYPCPAAEYEAACNPYIDKSRQAIFAEACDVKFNGGGYNVKLSEEELNTSKDWNIGDRYVMVHLRSHDKWRDYPKILTQALLIKLVKLGTKHDFEVLSVDSVFDYGIKKVRAIHHTHLNSIMGIIAGAMMLVGPDSAMVHIAGALDVDTLGIFGPTDPEIRLKYSRAYWMKGFERCGRQHCWYCPCRNKYCLKTLKPVTVANRVEKILMEDNWIC